MTTVEEADAWIGRVAIDSAGRKVGRITQVWIDDHSGRPAWATVETGRIRRRQAIAPLSGAASSEGRQQFACRKAEVASAPHVDAHRHLGLGDEWRLFSHYDLPGAPDPTRRSHPGEQPFTTGINTGPGRLGHGRPSMFLADIRRSLGLGSS